MITADNRIHCFEHSGVRLALDIASGAVHILDDLSHALCRRLEAPLGELCPPHLLDELSAEHTPDAIAEAYGELYTLWQEGLLFSEDLDIPVEAIKPQNTPVKALCLHVSHDCNLRCKYCFAQTGDFGTKRSLMEPETARAAIDFVIRSAKGRRNIEIDFFGGEPLMAWETVKDTVEYANVQGALHDKVFRFTVTTNGVLLSDGVIDYINTNMSNAVLSVDGRRDVNDAMRPTVSGAGSYDVIMPRFKKLVDGRDLDKDYYMRGTFTAQNLDFAADVLDLYAQGYDQISVEPVSAPEGAGFELRPEHLPAIEAEYWKLAEAMLALEAKGESLNFFHFNVDLEQGPCVIKRLRGCGAGCEYVAVTPEGDIYPCHQFVGNETFKMGNILAGTFDKTRAAQFAAVSVYTRPACRDCWARFYCSGGCSAANYFTHGDINISYEMGCALEKMRLECALYLAARRAMDAD